MINSNIINEKELNVIRHADELHKVVIDVKHSKPNATIIKEALLLKIEKDFKKADSDLILKVLDSYENFEKEFLKKPRFKKSKEELKNELYSKLINKIRTTRSWKYSSEYYKMPNNMYITDDNNNIFLNVPIILGANFINSYLTNIPKEKYENLLKKDGFLDSYVRYRYIPKLNKVIERCKGYWGDDINPSISEPSLEDTGYKFVISFPIKVCNETIKDKDLLIYAKFLNEIKINL